MAVKKFKMLNLICESCTLTSKEKLVAQYFVYKSNKTGECYPSVETIARHCGVSERTVQRATKKLQEKDYITIEKRYYKGRQSSNEYRLNTMLIEESRLEAAASSKDNDCMEEMEIIDLNEILLDTADTEMDLEKDNQVIIVENEKVNHTNSEIFNDFDYDDLDKELLESIYGQDSNNYIDVINLDRGNEKHVDIIVRDYRYNLCLSIILLVKLSKSIKNYGKMRTDKRNMKHVTEKWARFEIAYREIQTMVFKVAFFSLFKGCHGDTQIILYYFIESKY